MVSQSLQSGHQLVFTTFMYYSEDKSYPHFTLEKTEAKSG